MEFIDEPVFKQTRYKTRLFVEELKQNPNRWAVYRRLDHEDPRRAMVNCYSAVTRYRLRYPEIQWEPAKDDLGWYVAAFYKVDA